MDETATEAPRLASFRELRELAKASPVITGWIDARAFTIAATPWRTEGPSRAIPSRRDMERLFRQPSPEYPTFTGWLTRIAEDLIIADASAVLLGGRGLELDLIDPATVEPACDPYGKVRGFMQYSGEVPRRDFAEIVASPPPGVDPWLGLLPGGFIYLSAARRRWTPFGYSPLERAVARQAGGTVDLAATEERLRQAADDAWAAGTMDWLADALFGRVLERVAPGSRWKWDASEDL